MTCGPGSVVPKVLYFSKLTKLNQIHMVFNESHHFVLILTFCTRLQRLKPKNFAKYWQYVRQHVVNIL